MRVFVAGASGALGSRLVPQLISAGHEVIGTHHSPASAQLLRELGAEPVRLDLLDARAVRQAVLDSRSDAIVHQATALADVKFGRSLDKTFATTNRLRTEGTDALLAASREAGVHRFVAQSFAPYLYARQGGPIKTEAARLLAGPAAVVMATQVRGSSNAKAKRELGWTPRYPSWRLGFPMTYSAIAVADRPAAGRGTGATQARD